MTTNTQIADAIAYYAEQHCGGLDNCMEPVVVEVPLADLNPGDLQTVFVTSRLSAAAWPTATEVFDLTDSETLTDVREALEAGAVSLANLLDCWR